MIFANGGPELIALGDKEYLAGYFGTISNEIKKAGAEDLFPFLMKEIYKGELFYEELEGAYKEMCKVKRVLKKLPVSRIVWDYYDGIKYNEKVDIGDKNATNCYDYFIRPRTTTKVTEVILYILAVAYREKTGFSFGGFGSALDYDMNRRRAERTQKIIEDAGVTLTEEQKEKLRFPYRKLQDGETLDYVTIFYDKLYGKFSEGMTKEEVENTLNEVIKLINEKNLVDLNATW